VFAKLNGSKMITDSQILQRFAEFDQEAHTTLVTSHDTPQYPRTLLVDGDRVFTWWKNVLSLLRNPFGKDSEQYQQFCTFYHGDRYYNTSKDYYAIFISTYAGLVKSLIKTTTVSDVLKQAKIPLGTGEKDAACMMVGIALETVMGELCQRDPNIQPGECSQPSEGVNTVLYNAELYNRSKQNQISSWLNPHKNASSGESDKFARKDVLEMLQG
jgi:hypothetical protein